MTNQRFGESYPMSPRRQMANFDRLPSDLRDALRETVDDWCAYSFHLRAKKGEPFDAQLRQLLTADQRARREYHRDSELMDRRARAMRERRALEQELLDRQRLREAETRHQQGTLW